MSIELVPTDHLVAELQKRKAGEVQALRDQIAEHRKVIASLEAKIAALAGTKLAKTPSGKVDPKDADKAVLAALDASAVSLGAGKISEVVGFGGAALKASLARLEASKAIKRSGAARGTVYAVAA